MTYTTNDVRFQIPTIFDQSTSESKKRDLYILQLHLQGLWNHYYADGKTINSIHPHVILQDETSASIDVISASIPMHNIGPNAHAEVLVNLDKFKNLNDAFSLLMHELAHIYEVMLMTPELVDQRNVQYGQQSKFFEQWEKQHQIQCRKRRLQCTTGHQQFVCDLKTVMEFKNRYARIVDESTMVDIVMSKLPGLYQSREAYVHRFHGTVGNIINMLKDTTLESGVMTRQKIEKHFTPLAKQHLPIELHKHWDYMVYTMNSKGIREFDNDLVGNPMCVKNEKNTRGYTLQSVFQFIKQNSHDYLNEVVQQHKPIISSALQTYMDNTGTILTIK